MNYSTTIYPLELQTIDSSTFTGSYQALGSAFSAPVRILKISNNSDKNITISWDGSTDHDFVPAQSFVLYDFGTQRGNAAPAMDAAKGIQISVKGTTGTGLVYLAAFAATTPTMTIPS